MPGTPFLIKLRELGCDMNWLLGNDDKLPQEKLLKDIELLRKENEQLKEEMKRNKKLVDAVKETVSAYGKQK